MLCQVFIGAQGLPSLIWLNDDCDSVHQKAPTSHWKQWDFWMFTLTMDMLMTTFHSHYFYFIVYKVIAIDMLAFVSISIPFCDWWTLDNNLKCFVWIRPFVQTKLYKKVWCELDAMVKQTIKKTGRTERTCTHAIAIARVDCSVVQESKLLSKYYHNSVFFWYLFVITKLIP